MLPCGSTGMCLTGEGWVSCLLSCALFYTVSCGSGPGINVTEPYWLQRWGTWVAWGKDHICSTIMHHWNDNCWTEPYGGGGDGEPEGNAILADASSPLEWWLQKCRQSHESSIALPPLEWLQKSRQWHESFTTPSPLEWWLQKCRQRHESFCCFMNSRWHSHLKITIVGS